MLDSCWYEREVIFWVFPYPNADPIGKLSSGYRAYVEKATVADGQPLMYP